ncbi:MAG: hypothetical protein ACXQS8_06535 [Candidatus Helarchaeales archaeon]
MPDCPHCGEKYDEKTSKEFCPRCMRYFKFDYESNPFPPMDHDPPRRRSKVNEEIMELFMREMVKRKNSCFVEKKIDDKHLDDIKRIIDDKILIVGENIKGVELV